MSYAAQVATEAEKTTYYPEIYRQNEKNTSPSKNQDQKSKKTPIQKARERKMFKSGKKTMKSEKSRKQNTQENAQIPQISVSHASRGMWNIDKNTQTSMSTPPLRTPERQKTD